MNSNFGDFQKFTDLFEKFIDHLKICFHLLITVALVKHVFNILKGIVKSLSNNIWKKIVAIMIVMHKQQKGENNAIIHKCVEQYLSEIAMIFII